MKRSTPLLMMIAALLGAYVFLVSPLEGKREELRERLFVEYKTLRQHEEFIGSTEDAHAQVEEAVQELTDMEKHVIQKKDASLAFAELQKKVQRLAETSGMRVTSVKPLSAESRHGYAILPIFMDFTGSISNFSAFLRRLDKSSEFIAIDRMNISRVPLNKLRVKIQLSGLMKS
jgi:Tfp pilus assembly protein PilO